MKFAIFLLCLLPLAYGEKKGIVYDGHYNRTRDVLTPAEINGLVSAVVNRFGSNATEQECKQECKVLYNIGMLQFSCDMICNGIKGLIQGMHHDPPTTAATK